MAICRCKEKHSSPKGRVEEYVKAVLPVGYPRTSSICGRSNCENPGLIHLTRKEEREYNQGVRVFAFANMTTKVKVQ